MKKLLFFLVLLSISCKNANNTSKFDFETVFEKSEGKETATYEETIKYFSELAKSHSELSIQEIGVTDSFFN